MAITNQERVGRALELLREGLYPFVEREMRSVYQNKWLDVAAASVPEDHTLRRSTARILQEDVSALLILICNKWQRVFKKSLTYAERSLVSELRTTRNQWAHNGNFSTDDTYRALDSISRLLYAISALQADVVETQKQELLRLRFAEQTAEDTCQATDPAIQNKPQENSSSRYQDAEPTTNINMLNVTLTSHREFLPADTANQKLFIMLKLRPTKEVANTRPPTTFAFVIDTSGSMYEVVAGNPQPTGHTFRVDGQDYMTVSGGETKIDLVIQSLQELIWSGKLEQQDSIALIQFDDQASTLIGLTPATEINQLQKAIDNLRNFSGGTRMGLGLNRAIDLLADQNMTSRRALIFTDGETFDEFECREFAQKFASNGIPITALGVGEYNEDLLIELSDTTGGHLVHVVPGQATGTQVSITELPHTLFGEFSQAQQEVINNLALSVKTVKGVELERVTRVYPDQADFPLTMQPYPIGTAIANDETVFILEFNVDSRVSSRVRIAQLGLTYDIPGQNRRGELPPQNVVVQFVAGQNSAAQVDQEVMGYVQQRNISQLVSHATRVADQDPQEAERLMETARRLTVKIGNKAMEESLNEGIDELRKTRKISAGTRKTVKMGSKGKTVKMGSDINDDLPSEAEIRAFSGT